MDLKIKLITDSEVHNIIKDKSFISDWLRLAKKNKKPTFIQEPSFVIPWYTHYSTEFQPLLALGYNHDSRLVGFIPLAFSYKKNYLTHAGDHQGLYHGWICEPDIEETFLINTLISLKSKYPLKKWEWRWMPPNSGIKWLHSHMLKKEKIFVKIFREEVPVFDLTDAEKIKQIRNRKAIKGSINRYKRQGSFYLERIYDKNQVKKFFNTLANQIDFRQEAVHQTTPFSSDKHKMHFYIDRMNFPENNHFTVLWSNDIPIAIHFGACDEDSVYLGLTSYDPTLSKNSPGNILRVELLQMLSAEGFKYFDLTPGNDQYKEKFGNMHRELFKPIFCFGRLQKFKIEVNYFSRAIIKKWISFFGIPKGLVKNSIYTLSELLKKDPVRLLLTALKNIPALFFNKQSSFIYKISTDDEHLKNSQSTEEINVQGYSDLLSYDQTYPWPTRSKLLSEALKRFTNEDILYSVHNGELLLQFAWLTKGGKPHVIQNVNMKFDLSPEGFILHGFYTGPHQNNKELLSNQIKKMILDCINNDVSEVFVEVPGKSFQLKNEIEKIGGSIFQKFSRTRILGISVKKVKSFGNLRKT
ncbi:MAG: GNAT family N-acetyltransferase [Bacteroidales bacterium]|nr:GNAT family N-acetyltransferase [Bacteroidales bacterium]